MGGALCRFGSVSRRRCSHRAKNGKRRSLKPPRRSQTEWHANSLSTRRTVPHLGVTVEWRCRRRESAAIPPETCAVIETSAVLKQHSSTEMRRPKDYKLHQLQTSGTASGKNKHISVRLDANGPAGAVPDHADQKMSVTIAKTDDSNRVHYDIQAKSDTEIFRIANSPLNTSIFCPRKLSNWERAKRALRSGV